MRSHPPLGLDLNERNPATRDEAARQFSADGPSGKESSLAKNSLPLVIAGSGTLVISLVLASVDDDGFDLWLSLIAATLLALGMWGRRLQIRAGSTKWTPPPLWRDWFGGRSRRWWVGAIVGISSYLLILVAVEKQTQTVIRPGVTGVLATLAGGALGNWIGSRFHRSRSAPEIWENRRSPHRRAPASRALGTALIVVGTGIFVLVMPNVLRYVIHPRVRLDGEMVLLAVAAMMVVGGWFLRQPPKQ